MVVATLLDINVTLSPWDDALMLNSFMGGDNLDMTEEYAQNEPNEKSSIIHGINAYFLEIQKIAKIDLHPKDW